MSASRDTASGKLFSPGVLQQLDKENVTAANLPGRTPDRTRGKGGSVGFKVFQDESEAARPPTSKKERSHLQLAAVLTPTELEVSRYKEQYHQAQRTLNAQSQRIQELKATTASANERCTALLKSNEEATNELTLLRNQLARGRAGIDNVDRLKFMAEGLETGNELLRQERSSLEARLARRDAAISAMKNDLTGAAQRESSLREESRRLQTELETASRAASERVGAPDQGSGSEAQWALEKAALDAKISALEAQLVASGRQFAAAVAAERAVLAEESTRREKEDSSTVLALQEELQLLHRRTSAELGDWQRRHREALVAKQAAEGQLELLVGASDSVARVAEEQALLEASLQEAGTLLSQEAKRDAAATDRDHGPSSAERVVDGVLENILGRVFEATREKEEGGRERDRDQELRNETAVAPLETVGELTAEMVGHALTARNE